MKFPVLASNIYYLSVKPLFKAASSLSSTSSSSVFENIVSNDLPRDHAIWSSSLSFLSCSAEPLYISHASFFSPLLLLSQYFTLLLSFSCSVFNYINPWSGLKIEIVWTPNSASRCSNVTLSCVSPFLLCIVHFLSLNFSAINIQSIQIYLLLITLYQFLTNNNICSTRSSTSFF